MRKRLFIEELKRRLHVVGSRSVVVGAIVLAGLCTPVAARAAPSACAGLQEKYPDWKGKTLVNAINPHTPGYEAIDPKDPSKYVGFDIDLGEEIGACLGFKVTYKAVTFAVDTFWKAYMLLAQLRPCYTVVIWLEIALRSITKLIFTVIPRCALSFLRPATLALSTKFWHLVECESILL